ncbi:MAG: tetratricopeptide repeat protein [Nitrospirae bacterium]|nr:tetratricopeptide repeat protein [Nitrospirota bacterium]
METEEEIEELRRLNKQINTLYYTGKDEEWYALLKKALEKSKAIEAYRLFFYGQIARYKNTDYKQQEELIRKAIYIRPEDFFLIRNLGACLSNQGKEDEAIRYFDEALKIKPYDNLTLNDKGASLSRQGNFEEGIHYFDEALKIQPDDYLALNNKGASLTVNLFSIRQVP